MIIASIEKSRSVTPGYNHDIPFEGAVYHVQTEQAFWEGACLIVSEVYREGQVVGKRRAEWREGSQTEEERSRLAARVRQQHKEIIKCLLVGKLEKLGTGEVPTFKSLRRRKGDEKPSRWEQELAKVTSHHFVSQDLSLRRLLMRFVRAIGEYLPETREALAERLRSAANSIAVMLGSPDGSRLRRDELAEVMMLRSETRDYLRQPEAPLETGIELWNGFAEQARGFAEMNRRETLREHDRKALLQVLAAWDSDPAVGKEPPDEQSLQLLKNCWGRDGVLDSLMEDLRELTVEGLRPEVERILKSLGG